MQDILLAELLPSFNIIYLPLSISLTEKEMTTPRDCLMNTIESNDTEALANAFLNGLAHVLMSIGERERLAFSN